MKIFLLLPLFAFSAFSLSTYSKEELLPSSIMQLDPYFSHHIIVAEKSTHTLYLFQNNKGLPKLLKSYKMATGKKAGDKIFQGDHRTPEGVYFLTDFLTHKNLITRHGKQGEIYGVGAFVLNYPNPIDLRMQKTGGGIWLHSTNDETRIEKGLDSRGCIVTANKELIDIANYIELNKTSVIVTHDLNWLSQKAWKAKRESLKKSISGWLKAWQEESLKDYISFYHEDFHGPSRGNKDALHSYKRAVFAKAGAPSIQIKDLSLLEGHDYVIATFKQIYESKTIQDLGRKSLYLKKNEFYQWQIIAEVWTKAGINGKEQTPLNEFEPSMRFFKTRTPSQILESHLIQPRKELSSNN